MKNDREELLYQLFDYMKFTEDVESEEMTMEELENVSAATGLDYQRFLRAMKLKNGEREV